MTDQLRTLAEAEAVRELIAEIREMHERQERHEGEPALCLACSPADWPCDAVRAADALEDATRERDDALARIAEVAAKAWDEGWTARASRGYAHLKAGECVPPPDHINPYRKVANYTPSGSYGSVWSNREELHD